MTLEEAAAQADELAQQGDERGLATLRQQWDEELEHAARDSDYRVRAHAYRAIAQFRFRQKLELVRRGLQDESPAARGSALIALEGLSRDHPGDVNSMRAMLHEIASNDTNMAVRRLAIVCLKNGSAQRETILILNGMADDDEQEQDLRKTAKAVAAALTKRSREKSRSRAEVTALVGVIMGSRSDWETMRHACETLEALEVPFEQQVVSAHRTPDLLFEYAGSAEARGLQVLIAGAGGAAHLPGMAAAKTALPVLGVPVESKTLKGMDSLLSIVQMPAGVPVGTLAIGRAGAVNAALLAAAIVARSDAGVRERLARYREAQTESVLASPDPSA